uniref:Uncharacterized protein n=1 Tax=Picea sitchensis TaxID=3332 RepID=A9NS44_PICSI|nr:unknown [Picea sitchensis]
MSVCVFCVYCYYQVTGMECFLLELLVLTAWSDCKQFFV